MRNFLLYCCITFISINIFAQETLQDDFLANHRSNSIGFGTLVFSDPYLSPLTYNGIGLKFNTDNKKLLSVENKKISTQNRLSLNAGLLLNPAFTSANMFLGGNYLFGTYYHYRPLNNLLLMGGGTIDLDMGYKYIARNINNPFNLDLATNLNLSGIAFYNIQTRKRTLKLQLSLQSPLVGCMFVPEMGASYYEIFLLSNFQNTNHFSSIHNKRGLKSEFLVHIPCNRTVWHLGMEFQFLKYKANNMVFNKNELNLVAGTSFDLIKFAGRKKVKPSNFLSPVD